VEDIMAISNIEIVGIALIIVGIVFSYFTRTGKFSDKDAGGEISSKIFTLKGGTGLVLVALGVILLVFGGQQIQDQISTPAPTTSPTLTPTTAPLQTSIPTTAPPTTYPSTTEPSITIPSTTQPPTPSPEITQDYLIGTWISIQETATETIIFYSDYSFYGEVYNTYTGETLYLSGVYGLADSGLYLYIDGTSQYYPLTYIDQNSFKIDADTYTRVQEGF
jgi:hypothetical protein